MELIKDKTDFKMTNNTYYHLRLKKAIKNLQNNNPGRDQLIVYGDGVALRTKEDTQKVIFKDNTTKSLLQLINQRDKTNR